MTIRGIRNNNPGNIDRVKGVRWQGELPLAEQEKRDPRFVVFEGPEWGIRAIARVLITYQDKRRAKDGSKIDTIAEVIARWAPDDENDTRRYAEYVSRAMRMSAKGLIDVYKWDEIRALVCSIISYECGGPVSSFYDDATIDNGLIKAGLKPPAHITRSGVFEAAAGVAGTVAAAVPVVIEALPAAREGYEHAAEALAPTSPWLPWLPALAGLAAAVAIVALALRNRALSARLA